MITASQMGQPQKPTPADQQLMTLGRVLQCLREEDNIDVVIDTTISYLKEQFDYNLIWIGLYDRVEHRLLGKGGVSNYGDQSFLQQRFILNPGDLLEQVVIQQRPMGVPDLRAELRAGEWRRIAHNCNIQGTAIFPLRHKDCCVGVVLLGSERWGIAPTPNEKTRLTIVLGELAAVLCQIEISWQQAQKARSDEPLLELLATLGSLNSFEQRLEAVVEASQNFMQPTRTNVYWFERQRRYFWRRVSRPNTPTQVGDSQQSPAGITVHDVNELYQELASNQVVSIGDEHSTLKAGLTGKVLERMRVRSLLAAPIITGQNELLGFLSVEGNQARIWSEADKHFLKAAAQLIALTAPLETMDTTISQIQADAQLRSQVAQAVYSERQAQDILRNCSIQLLERFAASRFLLLLYDNEQGKYEILYQSQLQNRRPLTSAIDALTDIDREQLEAAEEAIAVENIEQDLRFYPWHEAFISTGIRSLLVGNCNPGKPPEGLVIIAHEATRTWTMLERELLAVVSQQLGMIVRQWQLYNQNQQQQKILHSFQHCLRILEQTDSYEQLERTALQHIASVLNCPLALLISWSPGQVVADIIPGVVANSRFSINQHYLIQLQDEALVQWALSREGVLAVNINDVPLATKHWLQGASIGQILIMALRTDAQHQPTAIILMADHGERQWSEDSLSAFQTLVGQLAWSRRHLKIAQTLETRTTELRQLNWYKHRRLEEIYRSVSVLLTHLNELGIPKDALNTMRYQQLLRQLGNVTLSMTQLLKQEQWRLAVNTDTVAIATLLKRAVARVDYLVQQRKIWLGVHSNGQQIRDDDTEPTTSTYANPSLSITGDILKIELILHEILVFACHRSPTGSRIDIWYRDLDQKSLEVAITDNGTIPPQVLAELEAGIGKDVLSPSILDQPPGVHILICRHLIQQLGGELNIYQLPDSRIVSRLILPLRA